MRRSRRGLQRRLVVARSGSERYEHADRGRDADTEDDARTVVHPDSRAHERIAAIDRRMHDLPGRQPMEYRHQRLPGQREFGCVSRRDEPERIDALASGFRE
jgi:hypothetical protein